MKIDWSLVIGFLIALLVYEVLKKHVLPKVGLGFEAGDESIVASFDE